MAAPEKRGWWLETDWIDFSTLRPKEEGCTKDEALDESRKASRASGYMQITSGPVGVSSFLFLLMTARSLAEKSGFGTETTTINNNGSITITFRHVASCFYGTNVENK